jgi:dolichol-phosphate mannosyltransferase
MRALLFARRHPLALILALGAALRLAVFAALLARDATLFASPDTDLYWLLGRNLAEHGVFQRSPEPGAEAETFRTPGYPVFLALCFKLFGERAAPVVLLQIVMGLMTIWIAARLVGRAVHPYAGGAAALLLALGPGQIFLNNLLLTETLATLLLLAGVAATFDSTRRAPIPLAAAGGLCIALSVLTRPFAILFWPIPFVFLVWAHRRNWGLAAMAALVWIVAYQAPVRAWVARNERRTGVATLTTIGGYNLLETRAATLRTIRFGETHERAMAALYAELDRRGEGRDWDETTRAAEARRLALETLRGDPLLLIRAGIESSAKLHLGVNAAFFQRVLFGRTAVEPLTGPARALFLLWALVRLGSLALVYSLAAIGAISLFRRRRWGEFGLFLASVAYPAVLLLAAHTAQSRYRVPFEPFWAALAGTGLAAFAFRFRSGGFALGPLADRPRTLVFIPVYNEVEKIRRLLDRFPFDSVDRVLVVDDGSNDGSERVVRDYPVEVIRHEKNQGVGAGLRDAIDYGRREGFHVLVVMAGNDKDDPAEIPLLTAPIVDGRADYVQGSRYLEKGGGVNTPFARSLAIQGYTAIFNLFSPTPCTDLTNGFRAYRLDLFDDPRIDHRQAWLERYELEYYVHFKAVMHGFRVTEAAVHKSYPKTRETPYSKIQTARDWWRIVRPMVFLFLRIKR